MLLLLQADQHAESDRIKCCDSRCAMDVHTRQQLAEIICLVSREDAEEEEERTSGPWEPEPDLTDRLILIKHAAAGVGPECRSRWVTVIV